MDVEFAFLADAAQASPDGKLHVLGAGIDQIVAPTFPATHPFLALVIKIALQPTEAGRPHHLEIQLWDSDGNRIAPELRAEFSAPRQAGAPMRPSFAQLILAITNQSYPRPGEYAFYVNVDGRELKRLPLYVHQGAAPAKPPPPT